MTTQVTRLVLLVGALTWIGSNVVNEPARATVGWCEANAASFPDVTRRGVNLSGQFVGGVYFDDMTWHAGGHTSAASCMESTRGTLQWCDLSCENPGSTPWEVCWFNPTAHRIENVMGALYFNPDGHEAFIQNGGTTLWSVEEESSFCCPMFGLNCP